MGNMSTNRVLFRLLVVVVVLLVSSVHSHSSGAGNGACTTLIPGHYGTTAKTTASPYSVTVSTNQYEPGGTVTVTLSGTQSFKGFLVVARPESNAEGENAGTFTVTTSGGKDLSQDKCSGGATHTADFSGSTQSSIEVIWNAPETDKGNLKFYATFVQVQADYWVKVPSPTVTFMESTTTPSNNPTSASSEGSNKATNTPQSLSTTSAATDTPQSLSTTSAATNASQSLSISKTSAAATTTKAEVVNDKTTSGGDSQLQMMRSTFLLTAIALLIQAIAM